MPGKEWDGTPRRGGGDYYCDGNNVGGSFCPEFDIMEANTYAFQATPHKCNSPSDKGHYDWCDGAGSCWQKGQATGQYGPGKTIDTNRQYHVKTYFDWNDHFTTTLSQDGNSVNLNGPDCGGYYPQIAGDLQAGMAITISMWGSDYGEMSWLDGDTGCQGGCYNEPTVYIKNVQVNTGGNSASVEEDLDWQHEIGQYDFGTKCRNLDDNQCGEIEGCTACHWSWPKDDKDYWNSDDAECRCRSKSKLPDNTEDKHAMKSEDSAHRYVKDVHLEKEVNIYEDGDESDDEDGDSMEAKLEFNSHLIDDDDDDEDDLDDKPAEADHTSLVDVQSLLENLALLEEEDVFIN